jgi:hypothetical protein
MLPLICDKCILTDYQTEPFINDKDPNHQDLVQYYIKGLDIHLKFDRKVDWENSKTLSEKNKIIFSGLIQNKKWPLAQEITIGENDLDDVINSSDYPRTPKERLDNLFLFFFSQQRFDGDSIDPNDIITYSSHSSLYFSTADEYRFYLKSLGEMGYIELTEWQGTVTRIRITFKGLNYAIQIQEENKFSLNCFIAMSFDDAMVNTREAIRKACVATGFIPVIIDEIHIDSDVTINDAIIAQLKKCKFCIADFTMQKDGVYFEAGFALGRGMKVIYTCNKIDFDKTHFDTNHFPHLIYETPEELTTALINKIDAFIKN